MDGVDGGWAVLYGAAPVTADSLNLSISEDQANDSEQSHTTEQVGYIVFDSVAPLRATAASTATATSSSPTARLTNKALAPIVEEAIIRWADVGLDSNAIETLRSTEVRVGELGGSLLAVTSGGVITLDRDAAGWGWFVDSTPNDDVEFRGYRDDTANGRVDLLTAASV